MIESVLVAAFLVIGRPNNDYKVEQLLVFVVFHTA